METFIGIAWTFLAAFFLGTFALPSKYVKNYAWENTWGAFFLIGMLIVPVGFSAIVVKGLWATYAEVDPMIIFGVVGLGALWGVGFCCWGKGLAMVGLSLGYSLTMGTMALVGSLFPFFLPSPDDAAVNPAGTAGGMMIIAGVIVCIIGVAINGKAGMLRERSQGTNQPEESAGNKIMLKGLIVCVLAGLLSSCCNIAYHIGGTLGPIAKISKETYGNPGYLSGLSVWTLIFLGGLISSFGFCAFQLTKNKTWGGFLNKGSGLNIIFATLMAIGHFACLFFYGVGAGYFGKVGTAVGFAIFQSGSIIIGNGLGAFTGEWKGADSKSKNWTLIGLGVLIVGIIIVSYGNYMISLIKEAVV
jgi:L-rhamnose-H+ transport protein